MFNKLPPERKAYLALITGLLSIGFTAIFIAIADAPGTVSVFYRMAIPGVLMALPFYSRVRSAGKSLPSTGVRFAIFGGVLFALDISFWSTGITMSGPTTPTLMANTAPVWVGLGSLLIFRERLNAMFWIGLAVAMTGALFVLGTDFSAGQEFGLGTFFGLLAAFFYGTYYLVTQRGRIYLDTLPYFWITTFTSATVLLLFNGLLGNSLVDYSLETYLAFLGLGILGQALGWLLINYAQGYLPASIVAPTLLGQPVVTAIVSVLFLGERFDLGHIVGGVLVLAGVYVVHRSRWVPIPEKIASG